MEEARQGMKQEKQPSELLEFVGSRDQSSWRLSTLNGWDRLTHPAHKEEIVTVANQLVEASQGVKSAANALEVVKPEAFGDEESYWTVYRMFTIRS